MISNNSKVIPTPPLNEAIRVNLSSFHLFTPNVMKARLKKWKWQSIKKYNGGYHGWGR